MLANVAVVATERAGQVVCAPGDEDSAEMRRRRATDESAQVDLAREEQWNGIRR